MSVETFEQQVCLPFYHSHEENDFSQVVRYINGDVGFLSEENTGSVIKIQWHFHVRDLICFVITASNDSCGKVMFSLVTVCPQAEGGYAWPHVSSRCAGMPGFMSLLEGWVCLVQCPFQGEGLASQVTCPEGGYSPSAFRPEGAPSQGYCPPQTIPPPGVLTPVHTHPLGHLAPDIPTLLGYSTPLDTPSPRYISQDAHPECSHLVVATEASGTHPTGVFSCYWV